MIAEKVFNGDKLSQEEIDKLNKVYRFICQNESADKFEIANLIGSTSERVGRDYASAIKQRVPIISHSGFKGFKVARTCEDVKDNERTIFEVLSRCEAMLCGIMKNFEFEKKNGIEFAKQEQAVKDFLDAMKEPKIAQFKIRE